MNNEKIYNEVETFLTEKLEETGANGYILGLSGGMDSAVAAKIVAEALGPEKLTCWIMPGEPSDEENMEDARELADELGCEVREIDISSAVNEFSDSVPFQIGKIAEGNIRARVRMVYEYIEANEKNKLVLGADNRSEIMLGYFTKYGDGATDVAPFSDIYKTELKEFAEYIGLDRKFIEKKPTAGLWEGQTDESELGDPYSTIDEILKNLLDREKSVQETAENTDLPEEKIERYRSMVENSEHKRKRPDSPELR